MYILMRIYLYNMICVYDVSGHWFTNLQLSKAWKLLNLYVCVYVVCYIFVYSYMSVRARVWVNVFVCWRACLYACVRLYVRVCVCVCLCDAPRMPNWNRACLQYTAHKVRKWECVCSYSGCEAMHPWKWRICTCPLPPFPTMYIYIQVNRWVSHNGYTNIQICKYTICSCWHPQYPSEKIFNVLTYLSSPRCMWCTYTHICIYRQRDADAWCRYVQHICTCTNKYNVYICIHILYISIHIVRIHVSIYEITHLIVCDVVMQP